MTLNDEERIRRGERAKAIIGDTLVVETFAAIEAQYVAEWRRHDNSPAERETAWQMVQNMDLFKSVFMTYINAGKFAAEKAASAEKRGKSGSSEP